MLICSLIIYTKFVFLKANDPKKTGQVRINLIYTDQCQSVSSVLSVFLSLKK